MKTLVDLAMMSAGETDIETDRVSCVHTTALGFAPFIFDLEKDTSFGKLISACESVWREIEKDKSLLEKLVRFCRMFCSFDSIDHHSLACCKTLAPLRRERMQGTIFIVAGIKSFLTVV